MLKTYGLLILLYKTLIKIKMTGMRDIFHELFEIIFVYVIWYEQAII